MLYEVITLKGVWKKICSEAWVVTAPSDYLRELIWKNDPSVRCEIVPNGIETNVYRQGPKEKSILTLSRLQEHKGVQDVIRAFSAKKPEAWTLTIAGDGPYRAELEKLEAENGVEKSVAFTGWIESKSEQLISRITSYNVCYTKLLRTEDKTCSSSTISAFCKPPSATRAYGGERKEKTASIVMPASYNFV